MPPAPTKKICASGIFEILRCIILRLCIPQFIIFSAAVGKEFFMTSELNDFSFMKYSNFVAEAA